VLNGRNPQHLEETAAEFSALGAEVLPVLADMSQTEEVDAMFEQAVARFGTVDLLVNNAAVMSTHDYLTGEEALLENSWRINVRGPYLCGQRAARLMVAAGSGNIVNISSVGGLRAHWRCLPYDLTKGALDAFTRTLSLEMARKGVRVNAIAPGAIRVERTRTPEDDPRMEAVVQRIPLARFGRPLEIGAAVAFLASEDAAYITGQVIYVDGGLTTQLTPFGQFV
jgi:NAD(P)-dependent dehydrogenase (short-subunit alcohol dehydrogenase family)